MFAALGTKVTVVERRDRMLEFCDLEIVEALKYHLRDLAVTFRFGETVAAVERHGRTAPSPSWTAASGSPPTPSCTRPAGRAPTDELGLDKAGLDGGQARPDHGRRALPAPRCRTSTPSATSSASRRWRPRRWSRAASPPTTPAASRCAACSRSSRSASTRSPRSASSAAPRTSSPTATIPFEVGISRYRELARGQIIGDSYGMLKLLVSPEDRSCSASTSSAPAPPSWSTSARR